MRACIYARVSTEDQTEGTSLGFQVRAMLAWANNNGYEVQDDHILREDWSGGVMERPLLDKAQQLARDGRIDALLVNEWDRLSRDTDHQTILRWKFSEWWGVKVLAVGEPQLDGFELKLHRGMAAIFAEWEKEKIRERMSRGRRERARQGKLIGGYRKYGTIYDKETGTSRKDPETWPILLRMFRWALRGESERGIARHLMSLAIPAPGGGKVWHPSTISRILRNRAYTGETYAFKYEYMEPKSRRKALSELRCRKTRREPRPEEQWVALPDATEPLIPLELFEAVQARLEGSAATYRTRRHRYLLTGRVMCSCGSRIHGHSSCEYRYYRCPTAKEGLCDARLLKADPLEGLVWGEVEKVLLDPELIVTQIEARGSGESEKANQQERAAISRRLANLDMEERRLYHLYGKRRYDRTKLDDEIDRVRTEQNALVSQLRELEGRLHARQEITERKRSIEEYCRRARENIEEFDFEQKRLALDALDVRVAIEGKRVTLSGVIPTRFGVRIPSSFTGTAL